MAHRFKVGDRVVVSHVLTNPTRRFVVGLNNVMKKRAGEVVTITRASRMYNARTPVYSIKEDGWTWSDDMFMRLEGD